MAGRGIAAGAGAVTGRVSMPGCQGADGWAAPTPRFRVAFGVRPGQGRGLLRERGGGLRLLPRQGGPRVLCRESRAARAVLSLWAGVCMPGGSAQGPPCAAPRRLVDRQEDRRHGGRICGGIFLALSRPERLRGDGRKLAQPAIDLGAFERALSLSHLILQGREGFRALSVCAGASRSFRVPCVEAAPRRSRREGPSLRCLSDIQEDVPTI